MASATTKNPAPLHDQTAFRRDLLAVIHANPGEMGLAMKADLDKLYEKEVNHGRLYPNLERLVEQGLVNKGRKDDRTNTYELTRRGERELASHLAWFTDRAGDLLDQDGSPLE